MSRLTTNGVTIAGMVLGFWLSGCSIVRDPGSIARETYREPSTLAAFLSRGQDIPVRNGSVDLELPIRIGLAFLPPAGNVSDAVPTADQRGIAQARVREVLLSVPYVSEVIIVPDYYLRPGVAGGLENLRELSRRFDWDLLAVLASDQTSYETRNFRSLGLITVLGADLWGGDVDKAVTAIELVIVEPTSSTVVLRMASGAAFGDTTTVLDDWRSSNHVRRESFDEAREVLLEHLAQKLVDLRSRLESPAGQRP